jgi:dynein heavy chain, axonemal
VVWQVRPLIAHRNFDPIVMEGKSIAAQGICEWVINIVKFYDINKHVAPMRRAVHTAELKLQDALAAARVLEEQVP